MTIDVLLATMFFEKEDKSFLDKMNINSDIIIGNQSSYDDTKIFSHNNNKVTVISRNDRGVGKNRNICLLHSTADIVIFADNDVKYYDGYREKVETYYKSHPQADVVVFNFKEKRGDEPLHDINKKNKKARFREITKFGTYAITARRSQITKEGILFSHLFGGGAKYSMGEDTLFLTTCYSKGLNIYLSDITLGEVVHSESTWFNGITEKYIHDKGALFKAINPKFCRMFIIYHVIKKYKKDYSKFGGICKVLKTMNKGAKDYCEK